MERKNDAAIAKLAHQMLEMRTELLEMKVMQMDLQKGMREMLSGINTLLQDRQSQHTPQAGFSKKRGRSELEAEDIKPVVDKSGSASAEIGKDQSQKDLNYPMSPAMNKNGSASAEIGKEQSQKDINYPKGPAMNKNGSASLKIGKKPSQMNANYPVKPKRSPSAFFVFMDDFRKVYKEEHPVNKSVSDVAKAAGEKWKSMSSAEKEIYVNKAEALKKEYVSNMNTYNTIRAQMSMKDGLTSPNTT